MATYGEPGHVQVLAVTEAGAPGLGGRDVVVEGLLHVYHVTVVTVERVQTGVRLERSIVKVLKGLAEYLDISLGELLEGVVLHAFDGKVPFGDETRAVIRELSSIYGMTLTSADAHNLTET
jgi:hypothetical protein